MDGGRKKNIWAYKVDVILKTSMTYFHLERLKKKNLLTSVIFVYSFYRQLENGLYDKGKHFSWGVPHLVGGMTGSESQPLLIVTSVPTVGVV